MMRRHATSRTTRSSSRLHNQYGSPAYLEALEPRQLMAADLFGNTPGTAEVVAGTLGATVTFADAVSATDTRDFFKVHLGANQILNASLTDLTANANLRIYNIAGELVGSSSNAGMADESINVALPQNADYYVLVCRATGDTNYTLNLSASAAVADGAGNTRGRSNDLGALADGATVTVNDFVGAVDLNDYYRLTISDLSVLTLNLSGLAVGSDADIQLINSDGNVIATSSLRGNVAESLRATLAAGTYYARVLSYSGGSAYTLELESNVLADTCGDTRASALDTGVVASDVTTYEDSLCAFDPTDYYTFVVTGESKINISLTGLSADATIKLLDMSGQLVKSSAKAGTASESISTDILAGIYFLRVSIASGETTYTLKTSLTPSAGAPVFSTNDGDLSPSSYGTYNELQIEGTSGNDLIVISSSSTTLSITINGHLNTYAITTGGKTIDDIVVYGDDGNDTVVLMNSLTLNCRIYGEEGNDTLVGRSKGHVTLVSIGGGTDKLYGNAESTSFWFDSGDAATTSSADLAAGRVHKVEAFYQPFEPNQSKPGYVSLELDGQNLQDPTPTPSPNPVYWQVGLRNMSSVPLWGDGPTLEDINQYGLGDCYYLAAIGGLAKFQTDALMERVVDLGDGTYAVEFTREGKDSYVRVDADLVTITDIGAGIENQYYNNLRTDGPLWACIMEKAYGFYREEGTNSYASIEGGYPNATLTDLGFGADRMSPSTNENMTFATISTALAENRTVILGTKPGVPAGIPLASSHAYTVIAANKDGSGNITYTVRNPWGVDGDGLESGNANDGLITVTAAQVSAGCNNLIWAL